MAMRNLFPKNNFHPEKMILVTIYVILVFSVLVMVSILNDKRRIAEDFCVGKKGILLQDKSGQFYCIKSKSIVSLSD
jgi:hypothetical protein